MATLHFRSSQPLVPTAPANRRQIKTYFLRFNTAENALKGAGIIESGRGKVRLLRPDELPADWDPKTDLRLTAWQSVHHLVRVLEAGGENGAAELVTKLGSKAEIARELAYRLYTVCERKKRAQEALSYNGLDEAVRKFLAWESILDEKDRLDLSPNQVKQAAAQKTAADGTVTARLPETYQWLLVPTQENRKHP